ncbi:hypothetical protein, partial [Stenotrophomonas sp. P5_B8]
MEELELDASRFWRDFDSACRGSYHDGTEQQYERLTLLALYAWVIQRDDLAEQETDRLPPGRSTTAWWGALMNHVRAKLDLAQALPFDGEGAPKDLIIHALRFLSGARALSRRTLAYFFDYRFLRLAENESGRHRFLSHFSASLANSTSRSKDTLVDVFCESGDLFATGGNERWRKVLSSIAPAIVFQVGSFDLEVRMRLSLHGKHSTRLRMLRPGDRSGRASFFRVDPPARRPLSSLLRGSIFEGTSSALQMLRSLQWDFGARNMLVVASGTERTTNRHAIMGIRRDLLEEGRLVAVIDFPRAPGDRVGKSAWLIRENLAMDRRGVLMINASAMEVPSGRQEYGSLAEFAGRIVNLFLGESVSSRWATSSHEDSAAHYRHLFDREFAGGYRNVKGLCRVVSQREIEAKGNVLLAQQYV